MLLGVLPPSHATYSTLRTTAADFIYSHPDDFIPFLPSVGGEDGRGALDSGLMTPQQLGQYCTAVRDTAVWGGEPEILALSRAYNIPIHIVQAGSPSIVMHNPTGAATQSSVSGKGVARISYHRRMYGLGEVSDSFYELVTRRANLAYHPALQFLASDKNIVVYPFSKQNDNQM